MNDILGEIGWGAVCVDGFIPPSAFMEFQPIKYWSLLLTYANSNTLNTPLRPTLFTKQPVMLPLLRIQNIPNTLTLRRDIKGYLQQEIMSGGRSHTSSFHH